MEDHVTGDWLADIGAEMFQGRYRFHNEDTGTCITIGLGTGRPAVTITDHDGHFVNLFEPCAWRRPQLLRFLDAIEMPHG